MSNIEKSIEKNPIGNIAEQLSNLKAEGILGKESSVADVEMMESIQAGSEGKTQLMGAVLTLQMAKTQPQKLKNLLSANFSNKPSSATKIRLSKKARRTQALSKMPTNTNTLTTDDDHTVYHPTHSDSLANSLAKILVQNFHNKSDKNSNTHLDQSLMLQESKTKLIRYLINIISNKNPYMAARLYAVSHFNDASIFDRFDGLEQETMDAYKRFLALIQKSGVK